MKIRNSVDKAKWSTAREEMYQTDCYNIVGNMNKELIVEDDKIYLLSGDEKKMLLDIFKPKMMWYEVWLKLKFDQ